jgi:hypothetical protein
MKRGYFVKENAGLHGVAVVASSARNAKKLAFNSGYFVDEYWTDIKSKLVQDADVSGMPSGVVPSHREGLQRGFYTIIDGICERCGIDEPLELYDGSALCVACILELGGEVK